MEQMALQKPQITEDFFVNQARSFLADLIDEEAVGSIDTQAAIRQIARRLKAGHNAVWSLKYRPPKSVSAGLYFSIAIAHEAMCERQQQKFAALQRANVRHGAVSQALARIGSHVAGEPAR